MAVTADRSVELRDLVSLGQIGVKIVFTVKFTVFRNRAVERKSQLDGIFDDGAVQLRESSRHARTDRADLDIDRAAECGGTAAEQLRLGGQLGVYFQAQYYYITFLF